MNKIKILRIRRKQFGTTMIELMTAIFIISVLSSITIPVYRRSIDKAKFNVCKENLINIATAIATFQLENKRYPDSLDELLPKKYLNSIPKCPATQMDTYSLGYRFDQSTGEFTLSCAGSNHASMGYNENEPYWTYSGNSSR